MNDRPRARSPGWESPDWSAPRVAKHTWRPRLDRWREYSLRIRLESARAYLDPVFLPWGIRARSLNRYSPDQSQIVHGPRVDDQASQQSGFVDRRVDRAARYPETLGVLAGVGMLAIPGIGPFIAGGPIMAGLAGLGVGEAVGGLVAALVG